MWLSAIRLILGPAMLWQGASVRRDILRMPEPDGPRIGSTGTGHPVSMLLLGDSAIAGVGVTTQDQALSGRLVQRLQKTNRIEWQIIGKTGWTTDDALQALKETTPKPTDLVIVSLGVNDVTTETGIAKWLATYTRLIELLRTQWQARTLILSGLPLMGLFPALPQPLRWYLGQQADAHQKALFNRFQSEADIICLPLVFDLEISAMAEDGFHPGPKVYDAWAHEITRVLQDRLPQTQSDQSAPATDDAHQSTGT